MKEESLITKMLKRKDIVLLAIVAALCLLLFRQCDSNLSLKSQIKIQNMNLDALKDTVRIQENKAGEATYVRKTLLSSKEDLEKLNKGLAEELDKQKGKVIVIEKVITETKVDTHSLFSVNNYRKFSGKSFFIVDTINNSVIPGKTRIDQDEMGFSFITGLREKDKALEIFVTPKYPGMKITDIEGAVIDPYKSDVLKSMFPNKKWSVGPYVGIGVGAGYGLNGKPIAGPVFNIGLGVQYSWFKF
jgi:hypothetical protein